VGLSGAAARDIALEVGREAAALVREGWGHVGRVSTKGGHATDLVTEWDTRAETLIAAGLRARAPGVAILGEELGEAPGERAGDGDPEDRWLVDPIDGTVNFAHGFPFFGVSIGYEVRGEPVAGVVLAPALGWTFAAARGEGATLDGAPIRVSETDALERAMLVTGFPYDRQTSPRNNFAAWDHMQRRANAVRRVGAASLELCMVGCGWFDGYWEMKLNAWDLAAGACVVLEAGGRITGLEGGPFASARGEAVASNGRIHDALVAELAGKL
jgi:myo-inositol-1(or 4)-monophosphatase